MPKKPCASPLNVNGRYEGRHEGSQGGRQIEFNDLLGDMKW